MKGSPVRVRASALRPRPDRRPSGQKVRVRLALGAAALLVAATACGGPTKEIGVKGTTFVAPPPPAAVTRQATRVARRDALVRRLLQGAPLRVEQSGNWISTSEGRTSPGSSSSSIYVGEPWSRSFPARSAERDGGSRARRIRAATADQPLTTPSGFSRTTGRARPARATTSTTRSTSL